MHDYFDIVLSQLSVGDVLYTTGDGADYCFVRLGRSRNCDAIVYSINENEKRISRTLLNAAKSSFDEQLSIDAGWFRENNFYDELNDGHCNVCVTQNILETYKLKLKTK